GRAGPGALEVDERTVVVELTRGGMLRKGDDKAHDRDRVLARRVPGNDFLLARLWLRQHDGQPSAERRRRRRTAAPDRPAYAQACGTTLPSSGCRRRRAAG